MTFKILLNARKACFVLSLAPLIARGQSPQDSASIPSPLEAVVVSATRSDQRMESLPSPVKVINAADIKASPATSVPDLLRAIPGFALRDYQSGLVSGPSQSIVSFRGLGGSSAGRVLVLLDGVPVGDPFSGWLDWARIPLSTIAAAEVIRGGGSIIWGSRALGGVVNLRTIDVRNNGVTVLGERGSYGTSHASGAATIRREKISAMIAADYVDSDGFILTPAEQAGPIDKAKDIRNRVVTGKATYDVTPSLQASLSGSTFKGGERPWGSRDYQDFDEGRAGIRWFTRSHGIVTANVFANHRIAHTRSFSINSDRTSEAPQRYGYSPASSQGIFAQWTQMLRDRHEMSSGIDFTSTGGSFAEQYSFVADAPSQERKSGGSQQFAGVFVQDAADLGHSIRMVASVRLDHVRSYDGERTVRDLSDHTLLSDSTIGAHADSRLTWSLGFRRQQSRWLSLRANAYEAFRAPSMYEMYFPRFSSRGTVTEANAQLDAERLRGLEGGLDVSLGSRVFARATAFTNRVMSPIMDITIATAGSNAEVIPPCGLMPARQTCSQRQNVAGLRSNGVESDLSWRPSPALAFNAGYSYSATRVRAPGQPADGKQALRSAPHSAVAGIVFENPRLFSASVEARYVSSRFEDDLNTIKLDAFTVVGLRVSREIAKRVSAHVKVENLLDEDFEIMRTRAGLAERGAPRWITAGVRTTW
ncbi:MAG TPA: TonB-dependent receptor [Gemmatimonadaceae bacterium]